MEPRTGKPSAVGRTLDFDRPIEDLEHPLGPGQALLNAIDDVGDLGHLGREVLQQAGEDDESGDQGELLVHHQVPAIRQQGNEIQRNEELDRGGEDAHPPEYPLLLVLDRTIRLTESLGLVFLPGESFDDLYPAHVLRKRQQHVVNQLPVPIVGRTYRAGEARSENPEDRRGGQAQKRESHVDAEHIGQVDAQRHDKHDHRNEHAVNKRAYVLHVAGHPIDERSACACRIIAEIHPLQLLIHLGPQINDDLLLREPRNGYRVNVVENQATGSPSTKTKTAKSADNPQRRPLHWRRKSQRPNWCRRTADATPHCIDCHAGYAQARQPKRDDRPLQGHQTRAAPSVAPSESEHPPNQDPVRLDGKSRARLRTWCNHRGYWVLAQRKGLGMGAMARLADESARAEGLPLVLGLAARDESLSADDKSPFLGTLVRFGKNLSTITRSEEIRRETVQCIPTECPVCISFFVLLAIEVVPWFLLRTYVGFFNACKGILRPPTTPTWSRIQRAGILLLIAAVVIFSLAGLSARILPLPGVSGMLGLLGMLPYLGYLAVGNLCLGTKAEAEKPIVRPESRVGQDRVASDGPP